MSCFSGKIKEFPQISVDRFDGRNLASTAYFLSHAHSDHMVGLSSPHFLDHLESNSGVFLYCSVITARFLQASIRYHPLVPFIRPLHPGESIKITVPNVTEETGQQLWVTVISAGHCPGSVMFLFEGRGMTVLYTGDFRIKVGDAERIAVLHESDGTVKAIDSLHIDTTFCHKDIMNFPTREESANAVGDLIEEWFAKGNNHLIHLVCPAKYGYEFVYKSLHDRFTMRVHVNRWKYDMYRTVPEILDCLTTDATETWIHSCERSSNEVEEGDESTVRQLPCRCVPYRVDTEPKIRVIKPSAMFYTLCPSVKDIKHLNIDGTFCRALLSMHASCSEVLDMVSYLRPRKVYPTVIPMTSSREEVLKLLHDALNRSGDHYSIEYGGGTNRQSLGSYKRQLQCSDISGSCSSNFDSSLLDSFLSSPAKRRRYSDSNMTLILPSPRGNIKGSLSLEGESRVDTEANITLSDELSKFSQSSQLKPWVDPYSPTSSSSEIDLSSSNTYHINSYHDNFDLPLIPININTVISDEVKINKIVKKNNAENKINSLSLDFDDDVDSSSGISGIRTQGSQESNDLSSVFSEDDVIEENANCRVSVFNPTSGSGSDESSIKKSRKLWYRHKYFSTPVHEEGDDRLKSGSHSSNIPRSSSLPLPENEWDEALSPDLFESDSRLPLITVSSPSDPANDSLVSDDTNVIFSGSSCEEPSDCDASEEKLPQRSVDRPSVICKPAIEQGETNVAGNCENGSKNLVVSPELIDLVSDSDCTPDLEEILVKVSEECNQEQQIRTSCLKTIRRKDNKVEVVTLDHT